MLASSPMSSNEEKAVIVPFQKLSPQALEGLIKEFILREGTDYGRREFSLEEKIEHVMNQLKAKHIHVVFDLKNESTSILRKEDIKKNYNSFLNELS